MSTQETKKPDKNFDFTGGWLPGVHPLRAGGKNYTSISNMEINKNGVCGTMGYSRLATLEQKTAAKSVTGLSRAAQCVVTCVDHGITSTDHPIQFSEITQDEWAGLVETGRIDIVSITDEDTLVIDYDTSAFEEAFDAQEQDEATCVFYNPVQYILARSGIQLRTPNNRRSIILVQATDAAQTASVLLEQVADSAQADVPAAVEFEPQSVYCEVSGAAAGRFGQWPRNHIAYCNGKETLVYAGPEIPPVKVFATDIVGDNPTKSREYSEQMGNDLQEHGQVISLNSTLSDKIKMVLSMDGTNNSTTVPDISGNEHVVTCNGNVKLKTAEKQFGTASANFPGAAGDYMSIPVYAKETCKFTDQDFMFEMRLFPAAYANEGIIGQYVDANNYWYLNVYPSKTTETHSYYNGISVVTVTTSKYYLTATFKIAVSGNTVAEYTWKKEVGVSSWSGMGGSFTGYNPQNTWKHCLLQRRGTTMDFFYDGAKIPIQTGPDAPVTTEINTASFPYFNAALIIGNTLNAANVLQGNIDEFIITAGESRPGEDFTPPLTALSGGFKCLTLMTTRPIHAAKIYLSSVNFKTDAVMTGQEWIGASYQALEIEDTTQGLHLDEQSIRFASTVGSAQPRFISGNLFYVYQFALSAGAAEIYRITVDAPIQPVVDLWDGVLRPVQSFRYYRNSKWIDKTLPVTEETPAGAAGNEVYVANVGGLTTSEYIDMYTTERACAFKIVMFTREVDKINTAAADLLVYYWNGVDYTNAPTLFNDTAEDSKTFRKNGFVAFQLPQTDHEQKKDYESVPMWHYRLKVSATLSAAVWIDCVQYVPSPQEINKAYTFPFMFQNRPMLCGRMDTNEPNRVDYGLTHSTEGWNGEQTSFGDGRSPLYIGGPEPLTCACEIYNRLGSSIYTFALFFKPYHLYILHGTDHETYKDYPINNKVGCPAPDTLDTFTIAASQEAQSARAIACWLSYFGPYMFDAGGLSPIPGLECYFDERDSRCINFANIHKAKGWWSTFGAKYNLQFPSGANQTENNVWVVHDFEVGRWYRIEPSCPAPYFNAVVRVADAQEKHYIYGFRENGAVMRVDHGSTFDASPIPQHVETGEILAADSLWEIIKPQLMKLIALSTDEPDMEITVTIYKDGAATGDVIMRIPFSATAADQLIRHTDRINPGDCSSFRVRFATQTQASPKGMQLLAWGYKLSPERTENR